MVSKDRVRKKVDGEQPPGGGNFARRGVFCRWVLQIQVPDKRRAITSKETTGLQWRTIQKILAGGGGRFKKREGQALKRLC